MATKEPVDKLPGPSSPRSGVISALSLPLAWLGAGPHPLTWVHLSPPQPPGETSPFAPGLVSTASESNSSLPGPPPLHVEDAQESGNITENTCGPGKGKLRVLYVGVLKAKISRDAKRIIDLDPKGLNSKALCLETSGKLILIILTAS